MANQYPCVNEHSKSRFINSKRGNRLLVDIYNYVYMWNKKKDDFTYWQCTERTKLACKSTACTDSGNNVVWTRRHNHVSDPVKVKVREETQKIIDSAKANPSLATAHLVTEWSKATMGPAERSCSTSHKTMRRRIQRTKTTKKHPAAPTTWDDLVDLDPQFKETFDSQKFLVCNEVLPTNDRLLVFGSFQGFKLLQKSQSWSADGTFGVVPTPFYQLYTVMAELNVRSYPVAFGLLPNKKSSTYLRFLQVIKQEAERHGQLQLEQFIIDFEAQMAKQVKIVFGRAVRLTGCQVHLYRNFRQKMGELGGLISLQCHMQIFSEFIRAIQGLCYVPPDQVRDYYKALVDSELDKILAKIDSGDLYEPDDADNVKMAVNYFLDYIEANYVGKRHRAGISKPRFDVEMWNQVQNVVENKQRTTNRNESFHSRLRKYIPNGSTLWTLIQLLVDIEARTRGQRDEDIQRVGGEDLDAEEEPNDKARFRLLQKNRAIKNLINNIDEYEKVDYLKRVSHIDV